jgi:hypothetical protein
MGQTCKTRKKMNRNRKFQWEFWLDISIVDMSITKQGILFLTDKNMP